MTIVRLKRLGYLAIALGLTSSCTFAQTSYHAAPCAVELDDWALTPITREAEGSQLVHSFLALNQGTTHGNTLQAV